MRITIQVKRAIQKIPKNHGRECSSPILPRALLEADNTVNVSCELVVRMPTSNVSEASPTKRILLGTVTPAPHHPRLVAQMSIPLTLTPINIGTRGPMDIHTISPEEMKDIVTVTGLWLIVREGLGLGGVKSRKSEVS